MREIIPRLEADEVRAPKHVKAAPKAAPARKLTNKEREALNSLPGLIETLEAEHTALSEKMASAEYYQDKSNDLSGDAAKLEKLEADTLAAYEQLEALEG